LPFANGWKSKLKKAESRESSRKSRPSELCRCSHGSVTRRPCECLPSSASASLARANTGSCRTDAFVWPFHDIIRSTLKEQFNHREHKENPPFQKRKLIAWRVKSLLLVSLLLCDLCDLCGYSTVVLESTPRSWPKNAVRFTLQSTLNLAPPVTWIDYTQSPAAISTRFTVTSAASDRVRFYLLKKP